MSEESKSKAGKVPILQMQNLTAAIGGAGDGALIDFITQDLRKFFIRQSLDWDKLEANLNAYAKKIFKDHIQVYAGFPMAAIPEVSFLIAVAMQGESRLYKWEKNFAFQLPQGKHDAVGIGLLQADQLISDIQFRFPYEQMVFLAVRMMQKVKQLVVGCGGKTEMSVLFNSGNSYVRLGTYVADEIEHMTEVTDDFWTEEILPFIADKSNLSAAQVEVTLERFKTAIRNLREKYLTLRPGIFTDPPPKPSISQKSKPKK